MMDATSVLNGSTIPGRLLLSTNQGATWTIVPGLAGIGRTTLAVGQAGDSIVYAFAARPDGHAQLDLFKSVDGGITWIALGVNGSQAPINPNPNQPDLNVMNRQASYNQAILVNPNDASRNTVYLRGELSSVKTTDGGKTWAVITDWLPSLFPSTTGLPYVHADFHAAVAIKLRADDDENRGVSNNAGAGIIFGTDGGIFLSADAGATFSFEKNDGIVSFLSQTVIMPPFATDRILTGMQDDGTRARLRSTSIFNQVVGGDGEGVGWSQANNAITMSSVPGGIFWSPGLSSNTVGTWMGFFFFNPLFFTEVATPTAAADPSGLLFLSASQFGVLVTFDGGNSWFFLARAGSRLPSNWTTRDTWHGVGLDPTPNQNNISVSGTAGRLAISRDGGLTWTVRFLISEVPGFQGFISTSLWMPDGTAYIGAESPIAGSIRVLRFDGLGFSRRDNGLPDAPVFHLVADLSDPSSNTLYAGTNIGVFRTTNGGLNWSLFGAGLPAVQATGLWVSPDGTLLRVATYGRGIWEIHPHEQDGDTEVANR